MLVSAVLAAVASWLVVPVSSTNRTYYIAAVEEDWDYGPGGNRVNDDTASSDLYLKNAVDRIGSVYLKAMFREYTDPSFTVRVPRPPHLGLLGPILRSEEGDTIVVVFRNLAFISGRNFSVHPHGMQYLKNAEGALYVDNTSGSFKLDDGVPPGQTFTYVWKLPNNFANTKDDNPCIPWAYHSHTVPHQDIDTGLVGLLTTCKKGTLTGPNGERRNVQAEYPLYVDTTDESSSWLFQENLNKCGNPDLCRQLADSPVIEDDLTSFQESNVKQHVNGRMYGNLEGLTARTRSRPVAFYFFSLSRDIKSIFVSGQIFSVRGQSQYAIQVYPATFVGSTMSPVNRGTWLLASTITEAYKGGQLAFFDVSDSSRRQLYPWSRSTGLRGKRSLDAGRIYSSSPDHNPAFPDDAAKADGSMAYHPPEAAPVWSGTPYWTQGQYSSGPSNSGPQPADRQFYLGIDDYEWDYGPSGQDLYFGGNLTDPSGRAAIYFSKEQNRVGGRYRKTRYLQFSDSSFSTLVPRDASEEHLGMLGPVLKMEAGETVTVTVRNFASRPYSFFPHGLLFTKDQEGLVYRNPQSGKLEGRVVVPGKTVTYRFLVPALERNDNPCISSIYQSALDPVLDLHTGLIGPLLLCQRGQLSRPGPSGYSRGFTSSSSWYEQHKHFFLNFFIVDETLSWHLKYNIDTHAPNPSRVDVKDPGFIGANRKHAINGLMFGNLIGLDVCRGENVAWHLFGVGDRFSVHGANFHGQALDRIGNHLNAKSVTPGVRFTLTSSPETVGQWSVACRTNFHFNAGMVAKYQVTDCPGVYYQEDQLRGVIRDYYIAAEEVKHDYAPIKIDSSTGESLFNESLTGYSFVRNDTGFIGSVYTKARYIRYTDSSFSVPFPQGPAEEHLGVLGPVVAAEVGDTIRVQFFNKASRPYSIHPQGVQYSKANEGTNYLDGGPPFAGGTVLPNEKFTYEWTVPPSSGPGPSDPSCIANMYYSSVDSVKDVYSGLIGPLLLCRPGMLMACGPYGKLRRRDVHRDFWQLYSIIDENDSWYLEQNTREYAPERFNLPGGLSDSSFVLSNTYHSINGKIYGNVRGMTMDLGDVVAWYLLGFGSSEDFHPVHYHGQTSILQTAKQQHRGDVFEVFSSTSETVTMLCDNPGEWLVHCHFQSHAVEGMEATYVIRPAGFGIDDVTQRRGKY